MGGFTPLESEAVEAQIYPIGKAATRTFRRAPRCRECETLESECIFSVRRHGAFIFYRFMTIEMEVWPQLRWVHAE